MSPIKRTCVFFFLCVAVYALLVAPWPGVLDAYRAGFRRAGDVLFYRVGGGVSVQFKPLVTERVGADTTLKLTRVGPSPAVKQMDIDAAYLAYRPAAFLVALVLATPIPWRRRLFALGWGLLGIHLFVALRVGVQLVAVLSVGDAVSVFSFSPAVTEAVQKIALVLFRAPATSYTAPAFIWLVVTFRRDDWQRLMSKPKPPAAPKPSRLLRKPRPVSRSDAKS